MKNLNIKIFDLKEQYKQISEEIEKDVLKVLRSGQYILGSNVIKIEEKFSKFLNTKYAISCNSGTDALLISLRCLGIKKNDEIITSPFTYFATAEVISLCGATPIFVDIKKDTFNINPDSLEIKINEVLREGKYRPKCILPVNLFGLLADYDKINEICYKYNLFLLEDAAQSFGATFENKKSCSFGNVSATSFYPAKPLGCYGDGGAIFTNESDLYNIMKSIRVHGEGIDKYHNDRIGLNSRLDTLQASVLLEKMNIFDEEVEKRNCIAKIYTKALKEKYQLQFISDRNISSWAQFSLLANSKEHREKIIKTLSNNNIPTSIYYAIPLHLQTAFNKLNYKNGDFPISEEISDLIFSIPMHPYLNEKDINKIINILIDEE